MSARVGYTGWMRFSLALALLLCFPAWAGAHLDLTSPTSRYGSEVLKDGPCGVSGGERTDNVTHFEPGETIEVRWDEYIDHPGHYRIAFDPEGDDDFIDPATMMELYSNDAVLLDGIDDEGPAQRYYSASVTLPDITCDHCTLQVIQVMYDKPPYVTPGNDIYYQCADLVLRAGGAPDGGVEPGGGGFGGFGFGGTIDGGVGGTGGNGAGGDTVAAAGADGGGCRAMRSMPNGGSALAFIVLLIGWRFARKGRLPV